MIHDIRFPSERGALVSCAILLALILQTIPVVASDAVQNSDNARYLVVWDPSTRPPDLGAIGATKESEWLNRLVISLPESAVAALAEQPAVIELQRLEGSEEQTVEIDAIIGRRTLERQNARVLTPLATADWVIGDANGDGSGGEYKYDASGNVTRIGDDAFAYDTSGRLKMSRVYVGGVAKSESYTIDGFGNLAGGLPGSRSVDMATNRVTGMTYDGAGRPTVNGIDVMSWDAEGILRRYDNGASRHAYVYDAAGERIGSTNLVVWRWTIRDTANRVVREYESPVVNATAWLWIEDRIYRGGAPLAVERPVAQGGVWNLHTDHLGSVRMVTNRGGQQVSRHMFAPFGAELTTINQARQLGYAEQPRRFTGHERDFNGGTDVNNANQLDYMHARYYSPVMGRFFSVDPSMDLKANLVSPQRWNRYNYVSNNPINKIDPDGRDEYAMEQRLTGINDDWDGRDKYQAGGLALLGVAATGVGAASALTGGGLAEGAFSLAPIARGWAIEAALAAKLGGGLPSNFPTIDRLSNGVATSVKSIDLMAKTYQNAARLTSVLSGYTDKLAKFTGGAVGQTIVKQGDMSKRVLEVAIQRGVATPQQLDAIRKAAAYAKKLDIELKVILIK